MKRPRALAVASAGGHWVQLRRLARVLDETRCWYVSTDAGYRTELPDEAGFFRVTDGSRWNKLKLLRMLLELAFVVARVRPKVVLTTGAAPGYFAVRLGKLLGAKTMWIDSIANSEELSLSGELAMKHADVVLTQWEHLADGERIYYRGAVL